MIKAVKGKIASDITEAIYKTYPFLWEKFGDHGRAKTEEDNIHHLDHLYTAYLMKDSQFFIEYTLWLNRVLTSRNVGTHLILDNYQRLIETLPKYLTEEDEVAAYLEYLRKGMDALQE